MTKNVWILFALSLGLAAYDLYAAFNGKPGDTITEIQRLLNQNPIFPFIAGMICGHLFWGKTL